jgi:hypothetical protein
VARPDLKLAQEVEKALEPYEHWWARRRDGTRDGAPDPSRAMCGAVLDPEREKKSGHLRANCPECIKTRARLYGYPSP